MKGARQATDSSWQLHRGWSYGLAAAVAALVVCPCALAEIKPSAQRADTLFEDAKTALAQGDWSAACEKFERSQALDPSPSTLVKIARCREHDGHFKAAWDTYAEAVALLGRSERQDPHARALDAMIRSAMQALDAKVGYLHVRCSPDNVQCALTIDGQHAASVHGAAPIRLDPGRHSIALEAPGYRGITTEVEIALGETRELALDLEALPSSPPVSAPKPLPSTMLPLKPMSTVPPAQATGPATASPGSSQRTIAYVSGGAGLVMLGGAALFGLRTRTLIKDAEAGHCDTAHAPYECDAEGMSKLDQAERMERGAIGFAVAGTLLIGTGIALFATAPARSTAETKMTLRLGPAGAWLGGSW